MGRAQVRSPLPRTNSQESKQEIDVLVERKITDVKFLLDNMSQLYEDKVKKATFNQIERLMGILKARNKSIYIEKCHSGNQHMCGRPGHDHSHHGHQHSE